MPPEGAWRIWLALCGRGWGKTKTGAEWVRDVAMASVCRIALVAATADDVRGTMVEGDSGILSCCPPWAQPKWEPSVGKAGVLTWPNGSQAFGYSAEMPRSLRGPQHHAAWCDELAAWSRMRDTWDMLRMGLRLGLNPRTLVTTTPTPAKLIQELVADRRIGKDGQPLVRLVRKSTFENAANLSPEFLDELKEKYEGTRLGRQELYGEILTDKPGALWTLSRLDELRVTTPLPVVEWLAKAGLIRIVVAVDPPATSGTNADECGIVVAGISAARHAYVLADRSERGLTPAEWAAKAIKAYHEFGADRIIAEVNNGGEMVGQVLLQVDPSIAYKAVRAGSRSGKVVRAEPIAALYEQGKVHHVNSFPKLEDQMCDFTIDFDKAKAGYSPDRVDALVWALTELCLGRTITVHSAAPRRPENPEPEPMADDEDAATKRPALSPGAGFARLQS